ncbi:undecaprenyl-phosphate glucose phosphotransferase [Abyssalbus ytuae]|uniref:Undecaprenyl-phosphate glucose phosphotransferase n=1 Tax=Abyssalbus ytuae TaxID=2926907 RepID=A0A9E6ZYR0_9FLAO|nr:undecaprenyl-phosphate glucose phosphotransferase [Abyssalbus ytuae]UOB19426.1 undecaprenyl-phosphate glucose phosphotransferase [Abyssalbus ytuae]
MIFKRGGFSGFLKPILYTLDLLVINLLAFYLPFALMHPVVFHIYISLLWILLSLKNEFYEVNRYSKVTHISILVFRQFIFFFLILYAFVGFFKEFMISRLLLAQYFFAVFLLVSSLKFLTYYLLRKYRERLKRNVRNVVVIGNNKKTEQLIKMFNERGEYGYDFKKQFCTKQPLFNLNQCFDYISSNNIDEIYCSISELKNSEIIEIIDYADNNLKEVKFIPDNKYIFAKKLKFEYYDYIPILSLREIPLDDPINSFLKRSFDIIFSSLVILLLLSWLTPLMALLIRLESKGPIFFRQKRNGLDNKEFDCYKFRSMAVNEDSDDKQATKNDMRITKIGKFIRKTSIDELPQFYNVFVGRMSVVGPRPHMVKQTYLYSQKIDKYMVRHFVKPGITGLAQVRGYRGEVETDADIVNRIKFDIFYIENWSIFLDLKIIVQTIVNAFKGEEKAY